ncbi:uncharacterized protein LOC136089928 [Hydra vulgaris]|uniref:Uncharacterized protein LOC136089928 n=1 Tax=Hydra vulgaris TaxID=6087 RepID=A0ABM4DCH6_HYDVU
MAFVMFAALGRVNKNEQLLLLTRAYKICSEHNIQDEINFLIKIFTENGHSYKQYSDIAKNYKYSTNKSSSQKIDTKNLVILPWVSKLSLVLRREFRKVGVKTVFRFGNPLINILCRNKSKLPPNSHPGVYQLNCTCGVCYIGKTRKKISTRIQEHKNNVTKANWDTSGIVEHSQHCNGKTNNYTRKIREAIEIQRVQCSKPKENVLNRDNGNLGMTISLNIEIASINSRNTFDCILKYKEHFENISKSSTTFP